MRVLLLTIVSLFSGFAVSNAAESSYYWHATPVGNTAQLLTLFCHGCQSNANGEQDQPLVSVLRDTLGDSNPANDRLSYVWLLSYSRLNFGQRILSAVPFFYWRVGEGSKSVSAHDTAPLFDLTTPQHPVLSEAGRDLLQWTLLDPMTTPVRASSRAYRTNQLDHERLHLEEAISYLRSAPASSDPAALTQTQLDTVIARLELRKRLLGGLVNQSRAARFGEESGFEQERIRSRNWELLRQCAEKTGLIFEPIDLAGTTGQYAILWFPAKQAPPSTGTSLSAVWKLLNIRDPWSDERLKPSKGSEPVPLAVYSLSYPKLPLLLVDFRDKLHVRRHEMAQRTINEITAGVIGISHFTNWYYYVAADLYDFVVDRHGAAMDQAARLDSYSQFRVKLALDNQLDPELREEMQRRVESLAVNPLEASPAREMQAAQARYKLLEAEAQDGGQLLTRLDKQRRAELAYFGETNKARLAESLFHDATLGLYTRRVKEDSWNLATLDCYRRVESDLTFLDSLVNAGTQPEVVYDTARIQASVTELSSLMPGISSRAVRAHAAATIDGLRNLSRDEMLQADCSLALTNLKGNTAPVRAAVASGIVTSSYFGAGTPNAVESVK